MQPAAPLTKGGSDAHRLLCDDARLRGVAEWRQIAKWLFSASRSIVASLT